MFGLLLTIVGSVLLEIGTSLGKKGVRMKLESIETNVFLTNLMVAGLFVSLAAIDWHNQHIATWSFLGIHLLVELILSYFTVHAIILSSRSTFGFLRVSTIPLLLLVDVVMGYRIGYFQMAGIAMITIMLLFLHINHGLEKKGIWYVIAASILPVLTMSLFKYNLNQGNSLISEQAIISTVSAIFFYIQARRKDAKPFRSLANPLVAYQALAHALATAALSFGFNLMTPSVHTAAKRSAAVVMSLASGKLLFKEKKLLVKVVAATLCVIGIILLAI